MAEMIDIVYVLLFMYNFICSIYGQIRRLANIDEPFYIGKHKLEMCLRTQYYLNIYLRFSRHLHFDVIYECKIGIDIS